MDVENIVNEPTEIECNIEEENETLSNALTLADKTSIDGIIETSTNFINRTITLVFDHHVESSVFEDNLSSIDIQGEHFENMVLLSLEDVDNNTKIVLSEETNNRIGALEESQEMQDEVIADILATI